MFRVVASVLSQMEAAIDFEFPLLVRFRGLDLELMMSYSINMYVPGIINM